MVACDEQSPAQGGEKEEPNEPPSDCRIIVYNGRRVLDEITDKVKEPFYEYNTLISKTGYYLKPVHKVYKKLPDGRTRIYEYYGRYWWRKEGKRWIYAGHVKPRKIRVDPPDHPLDGLSIIIEGEDIILDCRDFERFREYFKGLKFERYY
ncbi:MAG: hypothetical protein F7C37_04955 [Desulfurococcales archaeon]|nr:hypothetical protein [Desulfurococcales archaeon]MCE4622734.1 hypothetical protein [Desulfurococcales archaeon]MCE4626209.1 hypothetical protein [Desulfurococcales archaeon]